MSSFHFTSFSTLAYIFRISKVTRAAEEPVHASLVSFWITAFSCHPTIANTNTACRGTMVIANSTVNRRRYRRVLILSDGKLFASTSSLESDDFSMALGKPQPAIYHARATSPSAPVTHYRPRSTSTNSQITPRSPTTSFSGLSSPPNDSRPSSEHYRPRHQHSTKPFYPATSSSESCPSRHIARLESSSVRPPLFATKIQWVACPTRH